MHHIPPIAVSSSLDALDKLLSTADGIVHDVKIITDLEMNGVIQL